MTIAAVIPYHHPRGEGRGRASSCIVVIAKPGVRPEEWPHEEIEVGHLAPLEGTDRMIRVCGPPEVAAVVARVVALVTEHGVRRARIEEPAGMGVEADRGRAIVRAIGGAPLPFLLDIIPQAKGDMTARLGSLLKDEGGSVAYNATPSPPRGDRQHTASSGRNEAEPTPAPAVPQAPKVGRRIVGIDPGSRHIALVVVEELRVENVGGEVEIACGAVGAKPTLPSHVKGVAAHDPICVANATDREPQHERAQVVHAAHPATGHTWPQPIARMVAWLPLTIGRDVPMRSPKTIRRKDGSTYTKTTRHEVTDDDVLELLRTIAAWLAPLDVDAAVVESATHAHAGASAFLLRSQAIGGEIAGWLRAAGLPVTRVPSAMWRAQARKRAGLRKAKGPEAVAAEPSPTREPAGFAGRDHLAVPEGQSMTSVSLVALRGSKAQHSAGHTDTQAWPAAVRALVSGLPTLPPDAREHVLDAAGAALAGVQGAPVTPSREPTKTRAPRGTGKAWTPEKAQAQRDRRARERAEKGAPKAKAPRVLMCEKCGGPMTGHVRGLPCPERGAGG